MAAWRESYRGIVSDEVLDNLSVERRAAQWANSLADESHAYHHAFAAEVNSQVVGFAGYGAPQMKDTGFDGELFSIYILRAAHKQGVGRGLVYAVARALMQFDAGLGFEG